MSGAANFPTALDDDTSLLDVTDSVTSLVASHHNNLKEAIKALEKKVGIEQTTSPTSLDVRLGSATNSHNHGGASGFGQAINPSTLILPASAYPSTGANLADHLLSGAIHGINPTLYTAVPSGDTGLSTDTIADVAGCSLVLAPGNYLIWGAGHIQDGSAVYILCSITDGSNNGIAMGRSVRSTVSPQVVPIPPMPISPAATTTYKMRAQAGAGATVQRYAASLPGTSLAAIKFS